MDFGVFSELLTTNQLIILDKIKARFLKRCLGLPKNSSNSLVFLMSDELSMGKEVSSHFKLGPPAENSYNLIMERKMTELKCNGFLEGPAFKSNKWKEENQTNRHFITRITSNGLHNKICSQTHFHIPSLNCKCKLCDQSASNLYHISECPQRTTKSLTEFASSLWSIQNCNHLHKQ